MTSLLTGLQTLAFAAAGALLGTAIQSLVSSGVKKELGNADTALEELRGKVEEMEKKAEAGELVQVTRHRVVTELVEAARPALALRRARRPGRATHRLRVRCRRARCRRARGRGTTRERPMRVSRY
jgi:hypothetical protein